ncbi:MAG: 2-hydroxyacid dehydrogenase [Alphaproteobacteria bacterium]|nr:2-hydroxyacid dehydrogenase [Alphaproteobacteria bacterium]
MTKPALLSFHKNGVLGLDQLEDHFDIIKLWQEKDPEAAIQEHKDNIVAINCTIGQFITEKIIAALPNLKIIATFSVGFDHIDVKAAQKRGVAVTNTPDVLCAETADTGMALLLATAKRVVEGDMYVRVGKWLNGDMPLGVSLANKTVGIVGLGGIGSKVAKRCEAFEMNIVYYGPREKSEYSYPYYADLTEMAKICDFLILTCPGGEATANLVDAHVLDALGPKGILINIARGSVVDQPALIAALQGRRIAAAGLDVYNNEPHVPEEFISMDNVVLLPHIGSATVETRQAMGQLVVDNILAHINGKSLLTEVK